MSTQPPERAVPGLGASTVASQLPRSIVVLIGVVGVVAIGIGVKGAAGIVAPSMLALVLTIAVLPVDAAARRHGWPGWLATLTALVASYAILLVLLVGTVVCIVKLVNLLPTYASNFNDISDQVEKWLKSVGLDTDSTSDALKKINPSQIVDVLTGALSTILGAAGGVFLLVTVMFFFVTAVPGFGPRIAALARTKPELASSLRLFVNRTQRYLIMTAVFGAIVAVLDTGALYLLGVPLAVGLGVLLVHHELHPEHRLRHRRHPAGPDRAARLGMGADAGRDPRLLRPERHDPDLHPATLRGCHRGPQRGDDLPLPRSSGPSCSVRSAPCSPCR